jgi:hypothetical protein
MPEEQQTVEQVDVKKKKVRTCGECRWWEYEGENEAKVPVGHCHARPPTATPLGTVQPNLITGKPEPKILELTVWPRTTAKAYCGGFEEP